MEKRNLSLFGVIIFSGMMMAIGWWLIKPVDACCIHSSGRGPSGGGLSLVGKVYLGTESVDGAIVTISYEGESVTACTYMGEPNPAVCPEGTTDIAHPMEWHPFYFSELGSLVPTTEDGVLLEPVVLQVTAVYTTSDNQRLEVTAPYTLAPDTLDGYGNQRLDITLGTPLVGGVVDGGSIPFESMEGVQLNGQNELILETQASVSSNKVGQTLHKKPALPKWMQVAGMAGNEGDVYRPFRYPLTISGTYNVNDLFTFSHPIPNAHTIYPLNVYDDNGVLLGSGGYELGSMDYGTGVDGDLFINAGQTIYVDSVSGGLLSDVVEGSQVLSVENANAFAPGREVLIIQSQGVGVGNYEFGMIAFTSGSITLQDPLTFSYEANGAQVIQVPHYENVTIQDGGKLTAQAWNGNKGGVVAFRVRGQLQVNGEVTATGLGYRGGDRGEYNDPVRGHGWQGESYALNTLSQSRSANNGAGGGGQGDDHNRNVGAGGGGGGYALTGDNGLVGSGPDGTSQPGFGGSNYGISDLSTALYFGSGGGGGGADDATNGHGGYGGDGGGIIFASAMNINLGSSGSIEADGAEGLSGSHSHRTGGGGGGAAGSILIQANDIITDANNIHANGGYRGSGTDKNDGGLRGGNGGNGSAGRIHLMYCDTWVGTTTPVANTEPINCAIIRQLAGDPNTELLIPTSINGDTTYYIQYGQRQQYLIGSTQTYSFTLPQENYLDFSFELMLYNAGVTPVDISVDVGADGTVDWITSATQSPTTLSSPALTDSLNAYLANSGGDYGQETIIPIEITLSDSADLFLTTVMATPDVPPILVTGVATTTLIDTLPTYAEWSQLVVNAVIPLNDRAFVNVLNNNGELLTNVVLQDGGNQIDLSSLGNTPLQLQFVLESSILNSTPIIQNWELRWEPTTAVAYRVGGMVFDGFRNPLRGANVQILNDGRVIAETQSDDRGFYTTPPLAVLDNLQVRVLLRRGTETEYNFQVRYGLNSPENGPIIYRETQPFNIEPESPFTTHVMHVDFMVDSHNQFDTNLAYVHQRQIDDLAAIYQHTEEVVNFIEEGLGVSEMTPFSVSAYVGTTSSAYYDAQKGLVVLGQEYSDYENGNRPMNREWHEVFHHLMRDTIGFVEPNCIPYAGNHGGYYSNCATNDSWEEGWAVFWSSALADYLGQPTPHVYRMGDRYVYGAISLEDNWKAWSGHTIGYNFYSREEFAVATLLWDLYDATPDNLSLQYGEEESFALTRETLWSILSTPYESNDLSDMKDVYDALVMAGVGQEAGQNNTCGLTSLDELFVLHGFFADINGDKHHDCHEEVGLAGYPERPERRAIPTLDAFIRILTPDAGISETVTLAVDVNYPYLPVSNDSFTLPLVDGRFYLEPFPTDDGTVNMALWPHTDNLIATTPLTFTNQTYQDWIETAEQGETVYTHTASLEEGMLWLLDSGWNFMSVPLTLADPSPEAVFGDEVGLVYAYDGCDTVDPWKLYDPDPPPFAPPNDLTMLRPGMGLWVSKDTPSTLVVPGSHVISQERVLCEGWNLISSPVTQTTSIEQAFGSLLTEVDMVFTYDSTDANDPWKSYNPNLSPFAPANDLLTIEPRKAYWVSVSEVVVWEP